jgi:5-methylcytosine-specific restriction endonuclease McrA
MLKNYCVICENEIKIPIKKLNNKSYIKARKYCSHYCNNVARNINSRLTNLVYIQCNWCDKLVVKTKKRADSSKKKNFCSEKCHNKFMKYIKHDFIHNKKRVYKDYGPFWGIIRNEVRKQQNYKCADCGINEKEYGKQLSIHHKIPFSSFDTIEEANKLNNLVGICEPCHRKRHSGENHPLTYSEFGKNSELMKNVNIIHNSKLLLTDLITGNKTYSELSEKYNLTINHIRNINCGTKRSTTLTKGFKYPINKYAEFQWKYRNSTIDIDLVPLILYDIVNTELSLADISVKFNITLHQVQEISYGRFKEFHNHSLPLRKKRKLKIVRKSNP